MQQWVSFRVVLPFSKFTKDGNPVRRHALPLLAVGTLCLTIGMLLCCHIVERKTKEKTWKAAAPRKTKLTVAWLQKAGEVNDQQFKSYILRREKSSPLLDCIKKFLRHDVENVIITSHKDSNREMPKLTVLATTLSLSGFIVQFVGLRERLT